MSESKRSDGAVVIGAGAAGQKAAKALVKAGVAVTMIYPHPYSEEPVFMPHFLGNADAYRKELTKKKKMTCHATLDELTIPGVKYVVGVATAITEDNCVVVQDKEGKSGRVKFGAVVVATGFKYPAIMANPGETFEARQAFVEGFGARVGKADSILIGGGGPVACEMAGVLRQLNSAAKITMVFNQDRPMSSWTGTANQKVVDRFTALNVTLVPNTRMEKAEASFDKGVHATSTGKTYEADIYLPYFGAPNTEFVESSIPDSTTKRGAIKASLHGESSVRQGVFAVGVTDRTGARVTPVLEAEAELVAANVAASLAGRPMVKTTDSLNGMKALPAPFMLHVPLGGWSIYNGEVKGAPLPSWCGQCCGCCNPFCCCCACCGWCCAYPAGSGLQASCLQKMLLANGNFKKPHAYRAPEMAEMLRD